MSRCLVKSIHLLSLVSVLGRKVVAQIKKLQTTTDLLHPTLPSRRIVCAIAHGRNTDRRSTVPSRVLRNFSRHDQVTYCFPTHDYHTIYWRSELLRRLRRYNIFVSGLMVHKLTKYLQRNRPLWLPSIRLADLLRAFNSIPGTGVLHPQQVHEGSGCAVAMVGCNRDSRQNLSGPISARHDAPVIQFSIFHSVAPVCAIQAYLHGCDCGMNSLSSRRPCNNTRTAKGERTAQPWIGLHRQKVSFLPSPPA